MISSIYHINSDAGLNVIRSVFVCWVEAENQTEPCRMQLIMHITHVLRAHVNARRHGPGFDAVCIFRLSSAPTSIRRWLLANDGKRSVCLQLLSGLFPTRSAGSAAPRAAAAVRLFAIVWPRVYLTLEEKRCEHVPVANCQTLQSKQTMQMLRS